MTEIHDPRTEIQHEIHTGQVYSDTRTGDLLMLVYLDQNVYLFRTEEGNHRLGTRYELETTVGAGRFKLQPEAEPFGHTGHIRRVLQRADEYEEAGGRKGKHYADAMREAVAILTSTGAVDAHEEVEFEAVDGVGQTTADALRANGYNTRKDVRQTSDEELLAVRGVGEGNLANIRNHVH